MAGGGPKVFEESSLGAICALVYPNPNPNTPDRSRVKKTNLTLTLTLTLILTLRIPRTQQFILGLVYSSRNYHRLVTL